MVDRIFDADDRIGLDILCGIDQILERVFLIGRVARMSALAIPIRCGPDFADWDQDLAIGLAVEENAQEKILLIKIRIRSFHSTSVEAAQGTAESWRHHAANGSKKSVRSIVCSWPM